MATSSDSELYTGPSSGKLVFSVNLGELAGTVLDLTPALNPRNFRLIDCNAFVEQHQLCLYEFAELPNVPYAALSYPWRGNLMVDDRNSPWYWEDDLGTFAVRGAEDGDPTSLDVLLHVCTAASQLGYVWLDRLCILQTNKDDKAWQIARMYLIYASCETCYILPGGIRRLVGLDEETSWIHRGWTLQEAVVPKCAIVIYSWKRPIPLAISTVSGEFRLSELISGKSACTSLNILVESGHFQLADTIIGGDWQWYDFNVGIFPHGPSNAALIGALGDKGDRADADKEDLRLQAVWRSALLRTSSRPVDMIFSIMGIFGVSLDPHAFDPNDRLGATIALAREILRKGGKAHWIGAAYPLDPSPYLSTFPQFPETSVEGKAYIRLRDGSREPATDVMHSRVASGCWVSDVPGGSMDENGYFTFQAHALPVTRASIGHQSGPPGAVFTTLIREDTPGVLYHSVLLTANDGSVWEAPYANTPAGDAHASAYVVYIGREQQYSTPAFARYVDLNSLKGLLVEEHAPGMFHKTGYLDFGEEVEHVFKTRDKVTLTVGGPNLPSKAIHPSAGDPTPAATSSPQGPTQTRPRRAHCSPSCMFM